MEIRALGASVTADSAGVKTTVGKAQNVYICATADDLVTNVTTGGTFRMHENQVIVIQKDKEDEIHAGTATTHFTKIAYPRG
tara:strand:- start:18 stop:263 length:246 start_codon:yes stop_codon:yes gene_type:complete